jgi:hypothetical protein
VSRSFTVYPLNDYAAKGSVFENSKPGKLGSGLNHSQAKRSIKVYRFDHHGAIYGSTNENPKNPGDVSRLAGTCGSHPVRQCRRP